MNEQEKIAWLIVDEAFKGKTDLAGKPYIEHIQRVAKSFSDSTGIKIVAILHDLLEDCKEWNERVLRTFFSNDIVDAVVDLTYQKSHETYEAYILRVQANSWAKSVKIADLKDNMDITRLPSISQNDLDRLKKYHAAYHRLTKQ